MTDEFYERNLKSRNSFGWIELTTHVIMGEVGKAVRNGSSFPTPFWIMTRAVLPGKTADTSCEGMALWPMALCAQTT